MSLADRSPADVLPDNTTTGADNTAIRPDSTGAFADNTVASPDNTGTAGPGTTTATPDNTAPASGSTPEPATADQATPGEETPRPFYIPPSDLPAPSKTSSVLAKFSRFAHAASPKTSLSAVETLSQGLPTDRLVGWITTIVITAIAFVIRIVKLGQPDSIMFDETYYAKDAWSILLQGYEGNWVGNADTVNQQFAQGDYSALTTGGEWAVHPPIGKWLIGAGEWLFRQDNGGPSSFGWRFASLIFGSLMIFMVIRLARRLSRSTLIGGLAGLLLTVDGLNFVMSRIALLDVFQAFFIVAAVACVVADRDYFRNRLADHLRTLPGQTLAGQAGPFIFRPWLLLAGVMFGLGCATKWNTMGPLAVFGIVVVVWSWSARRLAGGGTRSWWAVVKDGIPAFVSMVVVSIVVYLLSWIPWLVTSGGYDRQWGAQNPDSWVVRHFGPALGSLWQYHVDTWGFDTGEQMATATHVYASKPWQWLLDARTTGIYAVNGIQPGDQGCTAAQGDTCLRVVTALGTPLLWWLGAIALVIALVWWLAGMDWRFGVAVLGFCSTWVPWIFSGRGAMFSFYGITMIPFTVIALAMVMGVVMGPANAGLRRQRGTIIVGTLVALIVLDFAFNYPIYTGELMTREHWSWRMWLPGWI